MEKDLRYKIEHIGDIFVSKVEKVCEAVTASTKGIVLTYNVGGLQKEKNRLIKKIGRRVVALRKRDPGLDIMNETSMIKLFYSLDKVEDKIGTSIRKRRERLYPKTRRSEQ